MDISILFLIQIVVTLIFCFKAAICDIKKGIIPDKLNILLICYGLISNFIFSLVTSDGIYIFASIFSLVLMFVVSYMGWKLNIWGGGDVKLFTAIATSIPFVLDISFLGIYPVSAVYPFFLTIIFNSILVSFPFLLFYLIIIVYDESEKYDDKRLFLSFLNITTLKQLIETNFNRQVAIKNLKEGMILNKFYFIDNRIYEEIYKLNGNLEVYKTENGNYYFKSGSAAGLTSKDVGLLKILNVQGYLVGDVSIKLSIPFAPSIAIGVLIAVTYGDIILILIKTLSFVI